MEMMKTPIMTAREQDKADRHQSHITAVPVQSASRQLNYREALPKYLENRSNEESGYYFQEESLHIHRHQKMI